MEDELYDSLLDEVHNYKCILQNIRKEINKFNIFGKYTKEDYEDSVQAINEVLEEVSV